MAGITYSDLVTKIRNYTEVDSTVLTDAIVNGFILDAEERILRDVNTDADRKYAVANMVLNQKFLNFPDGALVIRAIQITSGSEKIYLEKRDTTFIDEYNSTSATGIPKYYCCIFQLIQFFLTSFHKFHYHTFYVILFV